jgi:hypothetical protein
MLLRRAWRRRHSRASRAVTVTSVCMLQLRVLGSSIVDAAGAVCVLVVTGKLRVLLCLLCACVVQFTSQRDTVYPGVQGAYYWTEVLGVLYTCLSIFTCVWV